jgi:hypothetical protein
VWWFFVGFFIYFILFFVVFILSLISNRGVLATQSHIVQVAGDVVTVDRVEMNVTGTYDVGNGVTVTKLATGIYTANYPNGNTQFVEQQRYLPRIQRNEILI